MLSVTKLEEFLTGKGYAPTRYYTIGRNVAFVEVLCVATADIFLLSIPRKYELRGERGENTHKLRYIQTENSGKAEDYAERPEDLKLESMYPEVELSKQRINRSSGELTNLLESYYKRPIALGDIEDSNTLADTVRQMNRVKFCCQSLAYKLAIIHSGCLCVLLADNTSALFSIKRVRKNPGRKVFVCIDLESLYNDIDNLSTNLQTVKNGVFRVLDRNQERHSELLERMINEETSIADVSKEITDQKKRLKNYLKQFAKLMRSSAKTEKQLMEKLYDLEQGRGGYITGDTTRAHEKARILEKLNSIREAKGESIRHVMELTETRENVTLTVDQILFDNVVMFNQIISNFEKLRGLSTLAENV